MTLPDNYPELFPPASPTPGCIHVNQRCVLQTDNERCVVSVLGIIIAQYAVNDRMSEAHAMVNLVEQGHARQNQVARAFGFSTRTVRRFIERFSSGGLPALACVIGYPKGTPRLPPTRDHLLRRLKSEGASNSDIARHIGISEKAVRKHLKRLGWNEITTEYPLLTPVNTSDPNLSAFSKTPVGSVSITVSATSDPNLSAFPKTPVGGVSIPASATSHPNLSAFSEESSLDHNPDHRVIDRMLARAGLLKDAIPLFRPGPAVPRAGVLLSIPALLTTGVFDCAKTVYGDIGPAFYGLRTIVLTMLLMALLRIKRPEALKEHAPPDLGRLIGLDRAPEVKTLRRRLSSLAAFNRAAQFGHELAKRRIQTHGRNIGFLYLDGHVRVYHGKHSIPKTHVARMRLPMPATSDYWVNDQSGDPLFVVTAAANAGLAKMLPPLLLEIRRLVGERRVTVVFDRGGWSPRLFRDIIAQGFDILTYRKGRCRPVPLNCFHHFAAVIDGHSVEYTLADRGVWLLGGNLRLRQVTRLSIDGHQTHIITSRRDISAIDVAYRMFERWRQENFFKYLREEYALDALADHRLEPDDPARSVPNPIRKALDKKLHQSKMELQQLAAEYGLDAFTSAEAKRHTMRGFKIAASATGRAIAAAERLVAGIARKRAKVPLRVPVSEVVKGEVVRLATERKHLTNCLKMVAYQAEGELTRLVARHYHRAEDEGRTLVQAALASGADLFVTKTELRVVLAPMSSPHRTKAIAALCEELNAKAAVFPGSKLLLTISLRCQIKGKRRLKSAPMVT